jgi:hypothetical protein
MGDDVAGGEVLVIGIDLASTDDQVRRESRG